MIVRVCVAVDDINGWAAVSGWEDGSEGEMHEGRWEVMQNTADRLNAEVSPEASTTRFVWAVINIPAPGSDEEAKVI